MQTSTVTVAVMSTDDTPEYALDPNDVTTKYCRSRGKGGQNVNKLETCVVLKHLPTGIQVRCEDTRKRGKNEVIAWQRLKEKLDSIHEAEHEGKINETRSEQIGCGMRGDKRRTYRVQDGTVEDHITGRKAQLKKVMRGKLSILHK